MQLVAQVKLMVEEADKQLLLATIRAVNAGCTAMAKQVIDSKRFGRFAISAACYRPLRASGLPTALALAVICKLAETFAVRTGVKSFSDEGAIRLPRDAKSYKPYDNVSILTLSGRRIVKMVICDRARPLLKGKRGNPLLAFRDGEFYLLIPCEVPVPEPEDVDAALGVDLGIKAIATDSDGHTFAGGHLNSLRARHRRLRRKLQAKGTRSAKRLLKRRRRKERRFSRNVNHCISKQIVKNAQDTSRAIALEDLKGLLKRVTARRKQRTILNGWAFSQLRTYIAYKAEMAGVPIVIVDPRNTSRKCNQCGHTEKANRPNQATFLCKSCGHSENADINAARNIRDLGWAELSTGQTRRVA